MRERTPDRELYSKSLELDCKYAILREELFMIKSFHVCEYQIREL